MGNCEYCGSPIFPGEIVCSRCNAPVPNPTQQAAKESKKAKPVNKLVVGIIIAAAIIIGATSYFVIRPKILYYKIMHGIELDPGKTDKVSNYNEIDEENIMLTGVIAKCFEVGNQDAILKFTSDKKQIDCTMSVVCKKNLRDEVRSQLEDTLPGFNPDEPMTGVFYLNGIIPEYIEKYSAEGLRATDQYLAMLDAQPGDVVDVHLIHDIDTYDRAEDLKKVMEVSNLTVSLSLTYTKELGNDQYEFPTVK
jgi:hypothetical protein